MSDVIVSTTESTTDVTTTNDVTTVAITNTVVEISQATAGVQGPPGANSDPTYVFVTNKTGAQLNKGSIVYVSGANGTHTQVSLALATGDVTSARTLGWLAEDIANNATGLCCVEGYLDGINTQGVTEGAQLYLSPTTPGAFTETKPSAPDHMVYVGICAKASAGNGRVFVFVQNGAELEELHDVKIVSPQNNDLLRYVSGTALWENVASTAITVGSAITAGTSVYATNAGTSVYASTAGTSVYATNAGTAVDLSGSITKSQVSDFTSGTVASASTAQQAGTAVYATTSGSASVAGSAVAYTGSITISQITDLANATVTSAATAQQAGTAVYALTSGTADYATTSGTSVYATTSGTAVTISGSITRSQVSDYASGTVATITGSITRSQVSNFSSGTVAYATSAGFASEADTANNATNAVSANTAVTAGTASYATTAGTAVTISGSITNSQVSDFASGTVANISGTVAQSQVTNLTTDLAGKANLAGGNSFTGAQVVASSGTAIIPLVVRGTAGQSANILQIETAISTAIRVNSVGNTTFIGNITSQNNATFTPNSSAIVPLTVRGASGQTANLQEWQSNTGGTAARVNNQGSIILHNAGTTTVALSAPAGFGAFYSQTTSTIPIIARRFTGQTANILELQDDAGGTATWFNSSGYLRINGDPGGQLGITTFNASSRGIVVRGAASQSANLQEWQDSAGGTAARVNSTGSIITSQGFAVLGGASISGSIATLLQTSNATRIPLVVQGFTSQSADLQQWQTSSGSTALRVNSTGQLALNTASNLAQLGVVPASTATVGVVVQGLSGQSANLQTWQNSGGTVLASIGTTGDLTAPAVRTSSDYVVAGGVNNGGSIRISKSDAASAPPSNYVRLQVLAGTNANTLKLVAVGPNGSAVTILDNLA